MKLYKYIPILFLLLTFPSIEQWMNWEVGNTTIWWIVEGLMLCAFGQFAWKMRHHGSKTPLPIKMFLMWVACSSMYGLHMVQDWYWDAKALVGTTMMFLIGICFRYFSYPSNISKVTSIWCKIAMVGLWVLLPYMQYETVGRFLVPFSFVLIFWPFLKKKWMLIVLLFSSFVVIYGSMGARSSIVRFAFSAAISLTFIMPWLLNKLFFRLFCLSCFVVPFVLFWYGINGEFNVWELVEDSELSNVEARNSFNSEDNDELEKEKLGADTRTFLYVEVLTSAMKNDYVIEGRSLARGYDSDAFGETDLVKGRGERLDSEVSILNVFTHMGVIGVVLYFFVFFGAYWKVRKNSKNRYMRAICMCVAFRWVFAWVEDFGRFDLNNIYLWILITMCYSPYFLEMNDKQFKSFAKNFFGTGKKYHFRWKNLWKI